MEQKTVVQLMAEQKRQDSEFQKNRRIEIKNFKLLLERDPTARKLVWEILSYCNFYNVNQSTDSSVQYTEGKRSVGKEIIELMSEISPSLYPKLMLEIGDYDGRRDNPRSTRDSTDDTASGDYPYEPGA